MFQEFPSPYSDERCPCANNKTTETHRCPRCELLPQKPQNSAVERLNTSATPED